MKKIVVIIAVSLLLSAVRVSGDGIKYSQYFKNKTMRLDYFHSGDYQTEKFSVDRIVSDGIWPGSRINLTNKLNLGLYQYQVYDEGSGKLLFSQGFCSIFGEWQTIPEAKVLWGTFHESIRFPWPKKPVKVVVQKRDKVNDFAELWQTRIDPASRQVNPADLIHSTKTFSIIQSGSPQKKLDLVVLGDGYTEKEMTKFRQDANRLVKVLFTAEPFKSRKKDFNVYGVETPSLISGVNRPHPGVFKRTPLSVHYSSFDSERYALSYDNRLIRDTAAAVPYDFMVILINEQTYGGGGIYKLYATVAADNKFSDYIMIHELGHHLVGLADEYYSSSVSYDTSSKITVEPWELNITALLDKDNLKWKGLVDKNTPVPTPWLKQEFEKFSNGIQQERQRLRRIKAPEADIEALFQKQLAKETVMFNKMKYQNQVGAFEGAGYYAQGLFRPAVDCIMFTRHLSFCQVCRAALNQLLDQETAKN